MDKMQLKAVRPYANVKQGFLYTIMGEGYDWYQVLVNGRPMYTPKWVFGDEDE